MDTSIPTPEEIHAMTDQQYKVLENRLRRAAQRQGLRLVKSRRRDPRAYDYGTYCLVEGPPPSPRGGNWRSRTLVAGDQNTGYGMSLAEIAEQLWQCPSPHTGVGVFVAHTGN
jgi:hypothetical protein